MQENLGIAACHNFQINSENLALRRRFIGITEADREILLELLPWFKTVVASIVDAYYEHLFSFEQVRNFMKRFAKKQGISISALRGRLSNSQAEYLVGIFEGARDGWGLKYFANRVRIGLIHDRINMPYKWYIGSYVFLYERIIESIEESAFSRKKQSNIPIARSSLLKLMNYDMQAVGDAFLMSTLKSFGVGVESVITEGNSDSTEHIDQLKLQIDKLKMQSRLIADKDIDNPLVLERVPGTLGESFAVVIDNIRLFSNLLAENNELLTMIASSSEELSVSILEISQNSTMAKQVASVGQDRTKDAIDTVDKLKVDSTSIDDIINIMRKISDRTHLLALNAYIEAAHAGDAGRGFSVVAEEVKQLANESRKSADLVRSLVNQLKASTDRISEDLKTLGGTSDQISEHIEQIAVAIEEQNSVTRDLSDRIQTVADKNLELEKVMLNQD